MPASEQTILNTITALDDNLYNAYVNAIAERYLTASAAAEALGIDRLQVRRRLTGEVAVSLADLVHLYGAMGKAKSVNGLVDLVTKAAQG